jgi:hypothetical protein
VIYVIAHTRARARVSVGDNLVINNQCASEHVCCACEVGWKIHWNLQKKFAIKSATTVFHKKMNVI